MWFEDLVGFKEISPENVREKLYIEEDRIISKENGNSYQYGMLEIPTLKELKQKALPDIYRGRLKIEEVIGDIQELHCREENRNALFQAASQFNLLEMIGPHISPERGIGIYENDRTQGPACAIACGAGTIFRNYFVPLKNQIGQTVNHQVDCLNEIGAILNNDELELWKMKNGYALINQEGVLKINSLINNLNEKDREALKEKLRIGIQWNTEVTISDSKQIVSQAYCSALPVAYSDLDTFYWESFARLILEATYEATLYAGLINLEENYSNKVYLTFVGGGAFGNDIDWITESLFLALSKFKNTGLEVYIVSHSHSNFHINELIRKVNSRV